MANYDKPASPQEQAATLNQNQVQQILHVARTLDHIMSPVQFGDYVAAELDVARRVAEDRGYLSSQGEAALIGVALGTAVNNPQKTQVFHHTYPYLMDRLTETGIDEQDKSFVGSIVNHIAATGANTAGLLDIAGGIEEYSERRAQEGADANLVRATLYAIGFGVSTTDQITKNNMAVQLRKLAR